MSNTPSEELRLLLQEARSALWQPANVELCERIDDALARWGTPQPVAREPLTDEQLYEEKHNAVPQLFDLARDWADNKIHSYQFAHEAERIVNVVARRVEAAHGITQKGGSNAE